jgi:plasmid stabilization system protein ParE
MDNLELVLSDESEKDISAAYTWYEKQRAGLGDEFFLCLDAAFAGIARAPKTYEAMYLNIRRAVIMRFPYSIFFVEEPDRVFVLAVFHASRNPAV